MSLSDTSSQQNPYSDTNLQGNNPPVQLAVKERKSIILIAPEEIDWIQAAGDYICIHTGSKKHLLREKISHILLQLPPAYFAQIHRSTIVNLTRVVNVVSSASGETLLHLAGGDRLHVSRPFRAGLLKRFREEMHAPQGVRA